MANGIEPSISVSVLCLESEDMYAYLTKYIIFENEGG
jgi:hypothetical protein